MRQPTRNARSYMVAGDAGVSLLAEIRHNSSLPYNVVGFIDDDPKKAELVMHGVKVLGDGAETGC